MAANKYQDCIDMCNRCAAACFNCAGECLKEQDVHMMTTCIKLDLDCANICQVAVGMMGRDSKFIDSICTLCAQICDACAGECAKHSHDHCKQCAEACRKCAEACRKMAA